MGRPTIYPRATVRDRELHAVLAKQNRSFGWLADEAGFSRATVFAIGQGKGAPLATAQKLADALGVKVEKLFTVVDRDPKTVRPSQLELPAGES